MLPTGTPLVAAISVLDVLSKDQRHTVTDISVSSANLVTLKLGKVTVVWGGASEPQLKVDLEEGLDEDEAAARIMEVLHG